MKHGLERRVPALCLVRLQWMIQSLLQGDVAIIVLEGSQVLDLTLNVHIDVLIKIKVVGLVEIHKALPAATRHLTLNLHVR